MELVFPTTSQLNGLFTAQPFFEEDFISRRLGIDVDSTTYVNSPAMIMWDVLAPQWGLTSATAMDSAPKFVNGRAIREMHAKPIMFRDSQIITESQIIEARRPGASIRAGYDLAINAMRTGQKRLEGRIEQLNLQMLTGELRLDVDGVPFTVDYGFTAAQKPSVFDSPGYSGVPWSDPSSNPLLDIAKAAEALRYTGARRKVLVMDISVMSLIVNNPNVQDLLKQSPFAATIGAERLAAMLPDILGNGISEVILNNQGYINDDGVGTPFVDPTMCFIVGLTDEKLGAFASTVNAYTGMDSEPQAGRFIITTDNTKEPVPSYIVTCGIRGIPVLYRPDLVVAMKVLNN